MLWEYYGNDGPIIHPFVTKPGTRRNQDGGAGLAPSGDAGPDSTFRGTDRSILAVAREIDERERHGDLDRDPKKGLKDRIEFFSPHKLENMHVSPNLGLIFVEHMYFLSIA